MKLNAFVHRKRVATPNDPKLSDGSPETRATAERDEAKARHRPGFVVGAHDVTEAGKRPPALRQLNAGTAVRCSAWMA